MFAALQLAQLSSAEVFVDFPQSALVAAHRDVDDLDLDPPETPARFETVMAGDEIEHHNIHAAALALGGTAVHGDRRSQPDPADALHQFGDGGLTYLPQALADLDFADGDNHRAPPTRR